MQGVGLGKENAKASNMHRPRRAPQGESHLAPGSSFCSSPPAWLKGRQERNPGEGTERENHKVSCLLSTLALLPGKGLEEASSGSSGKRPSLPPSLLRQLLHLCLEAPEQSPNTSLRWPESHAWLHPGPGRSSKQGQCH